MDGKTIMIFSFVFLGYYCWEELTLPCLFFFCNYEMRNLINYSSSFAFAAFSSVFPNMMLAPSFCKLCV